MKTSDLMEVLQTSLQKHGDREIEVILDMEADGYVLFDIVNIFTITDSNFSIDPVLFIGLEEAAWDAEDNEVETPASKLVN